MKQALPKEAFVLQARADGIYKKCCNCGKDIKIDLAASPVCCPECGANMENKVYLIFKDDIDDACEIKGYILGTADDADRYCEELNKGHKYTWQDYTWEELDCLNGKL